MSKAGMRSIVAEWQTLLAHADLAKISLLGCFSRKLSYPE
jgi:hypothetical protein